MFRPLHRAAIGIVKRLPLPAARFALRAYNKALRLRGAEHIATTSFGARLYCSPRDLIQRMILYFGVWEPNVSKVIEQNLKPGDVFVDIGANVGYDTLLASACVGSTGRVVALEASPRTFALLERNLALNATAANVRAVNIAVSDRPGQLELYEIDEGNIGAATTLATRGGKKVANVEARPLDQILTTDEISRLRLVKLDVEGAEPPILCHILERLALYPATMDIVVEASAGEDFAGWQETFERLRDAGFTVWAIENEYDLDWYLRWRRSAPLERLDTMPARQQDALLTRRISLADSAPS